jgi:hypothetical protein
MLTMLNYREKEKTSFGKVFVNGSKFPAPARSGACQEQAPGAGRGIFTGGKELPGRVCDKPVWGKSVFASFGGERLELREA